MTVFSSHFSPYLSKFNIYSIQVNIWKNYNLIEIKQNNNNNNNTSAILTHLNIFEKKRGEERRKGQEGK